MPNVRNLIKLTDQELEQYVETSKTVVMATLNHDGWPHVVPMWYSVIDGLIQMHTYRSSQKVKNIERDPRGSVLIEDGEQYNELRGVFMRGRPSRSRCSWTGLASARRCSSPTTCETTSTPASIYPAESRPASCLASRMSEPWHAQSVQTLDGRWA